ncbi:MAG: dihydroorotate dehydrogenase [Anaerolineae bacterium]|nr:dihydroorotate dehydrogenase [Anaerolineae bacterium]
MPDWSYRPIFRPWLFLMPPARARDIGLKASEHIATRPLGKTFIHLIGHMTPPETVACEALGVEMRSPVGLGAGLDVDGSAITAFSRFGFGFLEVGSITLEPNQIDEEIGRDEAHEALIYPRQRSNQGVMALVDKLKRPDAYRAAIGVRLGYREGASAQEAARERGEMIRALHPYVSFFTVETQREVQSGAWTAADWDGQIASMSAALDQGSPRRALLIAIRPDDAREAIRTMIEGGLRHGLSGVVIDDGQREGESVRYGRTAHPDCLALVAFVRQTWGDKLTIIAAGGIHAPAEALAVFAAGADLVQIHSGFVYAGPGLPKRINEALAYYQPNRALVSPPQVRTLGISAWKWAVTMGLGLFVAAVFVWLVAITRVTLPYDEQFVGLDHAQLVSITPTLMPFLAHDRISLAGTMLSSAILYTGIAAFALRQRQDWARQALLISGSVGYLSFFLFLGFGYLDPLHALLTAGLLPAFLFGLRGQTFQTSRTPPPNLQNDRAWLRGLYGQLCFIVMGIGLFVGGILIVQTGLVSVFVPQDLAYMNITAEALRAVSPRLLPLIAHDRVGFGGALISNGLVALLFSLWGFRQGARWVWWTLVLAGLPGFIGAIGIHFVVGYTDFIHLLPPYLAAIFYVAGAVLSYAFLCGSGSGSVPNLHREMQMGGQQKIETAIP